jgi:phosphoserine phosphatase
VSGIRIVFFDVDSTLSAIEGIDELAAGNAEIAALTEAAMNGELRMEEVYARRLEIIRPSRARIDELAKLYTERMIPDAPDVVAKLQEAGVEVLIVSAGIRQAILPLAERLRIPSRAVHAVDLVFDERGDYVDFDRRSPMTRSGGKEIVVMNVRSRTKGKAAFVGDGVTDLEAKPAVNLFIGFGGVKVREQVRSGADAFIAEPRLGAVVDLVLGKG